jgi:hypothetical protein
MGTLASELGVHAGRIAGRPRVYVDANMPSGLVTFMRVRLQWDTLFVIEHEDLRRARDDEHFRQARELSRTLLTLDRDYLDDEAFPLEESGGVIVLTAPDETAYRALLVEIDDGVFRRASSGENGRVLPLDKRKLHVHPGWTHAPRLP